MTRRNALMTKPPAAVESALTRVGSSLKTARVRRGWSQAQMAERIGTGVRAVADAERGKSSTAAVVYVALLWALGLEHEFTLLADPTRDEVGRTLAARRERGRAGAARGVDRDF
ncbi:MAG: helix-turn-helix domain-containing protein [Archangium sp.]|nr:helix-turn-helix domain-containing protein [Archangium sp.]